MSCPYLKWSHEKHCEICVLTKEPTGVSLVCDFDYDTDCKNYKEQKGGEKEEGVDNGYRVISLYKDGRASYSEKLYKTKANALRRAKSKLAAAGIERVFIRFMSAGQAVDIKKII